MKFKVEEKVFSIAPKRDSSVSEAKKTIFGRRYGLPDFIFLFLFELGICVQNLIFTKVVEYCQNNYFLQRGMLKFTYKGRFLTIKLAYEKFLDQKSEWWKHALVPPLHIDFFFLKNTKISIFGGISKFHLWADFGSFGQIFLHSHWLRACMNLG
jgi:hypothetical protein